MERERLLFWGMEMVREPFMQVVEEHQWTILKEFKEIDVSGYKVLMDRRDAINEIKELALKKEFDILLVYMADRISRKESEGPELIKWFSAAGIEVWTTHDGCLRTKTRTDKLINYMRYWQAEGESENTSIRVSDSHKQLVEAGLWRGGTPPLGYIPSHLVLSLWP